MAPWEHSRRACEGASACTDLRCAALGCPVLRARPRAAGHGGTPGFAGGARAGAIVGSSARLQPGP
eukprot:7266696-Alexandrium_andersonii.AAC.1